jgi:hypothetical protein
MLIRRAIEEHKSPSAPRLDPLRSALAKLDPAAAAAPIRRPADAQKRQAWPTQQPKSPKGRPRGS